MKRLLVMTLMLALLVLAGCSGTTKVPGATIRDTEKDRDLWIEMSRSDLESMYGEPEEEDGNGFWYADRRLYVEYFENRAIQLYLVVEGSQGRWTMMETVTDGSSMDEALAAFGGEPMNQMEDFFADYHYPETKSITSLLFMEEGLVSVRLYRVAQ